MNTCFTRCRFYVPRTGSFTAQNEEIITKIVTISLFENDWQVEVLRSLYILCSASKLAQRTSVAETEKAQLQLEVDELRAKVNGLKQKYDEAVIDNRSKMNMEEHIDSLSAIKQ